MARHERTLKGRTCIVGVGESSYHKRGTSPDPEFRMCLQSILMAAEDAGLDVHGLDGFCSYADDRNEPTRLATALGIGELRFASTVWGGGGGGACGAVAHAAAAVSSGLAEAVVVYRALAQGEFQRYGHATPRAEVSGPLAYSVPYGIVAPAQHFAMKVMRYMHEHAIGPKAARAIALASYHHAQSNPRAVMYGRPLTPETYDEARWIAEPFRLYDCCQESDGAAAVIVTSAERAADLRAPAVHVAAALQGSDHQQGIELLHNEADYASSNFTTLARRLYEAAGITSQDIDVVQSYEHFTGGVVMALAAHGFFAPEEANEFLTVDNLIAPSGRLPLNTSGGNLAECYVHGMELIVEASRQVRGESTAQVPGVEHSLVISCPLVVPTSSLVLAADAP